MRIFITLIFLASFCAQLSATHILAGQISYKWVTGKQYVVKLELYRDCNGTSAPNSAQIAISSYSCQDTFSVSLPNVSMVNVSPLCPLYTSTCNGGTSPGYELYTYEDTVTLPNNCSDWLFEFTLCCRPGGITNITNPSVEQMHISAGLDNLSTPFNNAPDLNHLLTSVFYDGYSYDVDYSVMDLEGDSIAYRLIAPQNAYNQSVNLQSGFTLIDPFSSGVFSLDSADGQMNFLLNNGPMELDYALEVTEYRNINNSMLIIGKHIIDLHYLVISVASGSNMAPQLSGINNSSSSLISVCSDDTTTFYIKIVDPDSTIANFSILDTVPGLSFYSQFHTSGTSYLHFRHYSDSTLVLAQPYMFRISASDGQCVNSNDIKSYFIYVGNCDTSSVWPGDSDNDRSVTPWDVLPIGLGYGLSGDGRSPASSAWSAQVAPADWGNQFYNGLDYKFADCDGNGLIDSLDVNIIDQNMYQTHQQAPPFVPSVRNSYGDLFFSTIDTFFRENQHVEIPISLGRFGQPAIEAYGFAFSINYDVNFVHKYLTDFKIDGWLCSGMNQSLYNHMTVQYRDDSVGRLDVAMVRVDGQNIVGNGEIGKMIVIMEENIAGNILQLDFDNITVIDNLGNHIPIEGFTHSAIILPDTITSLANDKSLLNISLYPNPVANKIYIQNAINTQLRVYDIFGRKCVVRDIENNLQNINLEGFTKGLYVFEFFGENCSQKKKVIVR